MTSPIADAWDSLAGEMPFKPSPGARNLFFLGAYAAASRLSTAAKTGKQETVAAILSELKDYMDSQLSSPPKIALGS